MCLKTTYISFNLKTKHQINRSNCVNWHLQLRTRGFCWCKVLLHACPCWLQPVHSDYGEDAGVLLNSVICTVSIPWLSPHHQLKSLDMPVCEIRPLSSIRLTLTRLHSQCYHDSVSCRWRLPSRHCGSFNNWVTFFSLPSSTNTSQAGKLVTAALELWIATLGSQITGSRLHF